MEISSTFFDRRPDTSLTESVRLLPRLVTPFVTTEAKIPFFHPTTDTTSHTDTISPILLSRPHTPQLAFFSIPLTIHQTTHIGPNESSLPSWSTEDLTPTYRTAALLEANSCRNLENRNSHRNLIAFDRCMRWLVVAKLTGFCLRLRVRVSGGVGLITTPSR
ncbi:hypothetical protein HAX54_040482 [Datura stramonium]|uniref:Uncharacterized protein n=1 Tax=Datura stramonium TaxID=4076 RepID=A0ABS8VPM0_DATST|nr:hypothetical protein [Datura stramonium]